MEPFSDEDKRTVGRTALAALEQARSDVEEAAALLTRWLPGVPLPEYEIAENFTALFAQRSKEVTQGDDVMQWRLMEGKPFSEAEWAEMEHDVIIRMKALAAERRVGAFLAQLAALGLAPRDIAPEELSSLWLETERR